MGEAEPRPPATSGDARAGLLDGRWRVRRAALYWIAVHGDADDLRAVLPLLHDPRSRVRAFAMEAISRDPARAADAGIEPVPLLIERALEDESLRVRRQAVAQLAFRHAHPHLCGLFQHLLDTERDPLLHRNAGIGLVLSRGASC